MGENGPYKTPAPILVAAEDDRMIDRFYEQTEHAAYDEYPEKVEEVELDIAFAGFVTSQCSLFGSFPRFHVAQLASQFALFGKGRVDVDHKGDGEDQSDERCDDSLQAESVNHNVAQEKRDVQDNQRFERMAGQASFVA